MIEIFDSLVHPTINGTWLNPRFNSHCGLDTLLRDMSQYGISKALAVGLAGVGGYTPELFIEFLAPYPQLIPIAFCDPRQNINSLEALKKIGYVGIKIHPRLSHLSGDEKCIFDCIKQANAVGLKVLYCGFLGASEKFAEMVGEYPLIFLHAGGRKFLETFNVLKDKDTVLLDLSYTLTQFPEMDTIISDILKDYSDRFCVGSDHPEVSLFALRKGFEHVTNGLTQFQKRLIAHKNIEIFFNF